MLRLVNLALVIVMMVPLNGCLGTIVHSPTPASRSHDTTRIHILAAPTSIDAFSCKNGLAETFTYVPLWGVAVGVLTLGILVPMTTIYSCVPVE